MLGSAALLLANVNNELVYWQRSIGGYDSCGRSTDATNIQHVTHSSILMLYTCVRYRFQHLAAAVALLLLLLL